MKTSTEAVLAVPTSVSQVQRADMENRKIARAITWGVLGDLLGIPRDFSGVIVVESEGIYFRA